MHMKQNCRRPSPFCRIEIADMLVVLAPVFVAQLVTFKCDIANSAKCLQASPLLLLGNETNGADATVWPRCELRAAAAVTRSVPD